MWLHNEIVEFYNFIQPSQQEKESREKSTKKVIEFLQTKVPEAKVYIFGSYYNKLYLPNSDIDIVMI